jgi:hypothetical protein
LDTLLKDGQNKDRKDIKIDIPEADLMTVVKNIVNKEDKETKIDHQLPLTNSSVKIIDNFTPSNSVKME